MELLTYDQAAELLGVKRGTLYSWVHLKRVPHIRLSKRCVRFDRRELEAWIAKKKVAPAKRSGGA